MSAAGVLLECVSVCCLWLCCRAPSMLVGPVACPSTHCTLGCCSTILRSGWGSRRRVVRKGGPAQPLHRATQNPCARPTAIALCSPPLCRLPPCHVSGSQQRGDKHPQAHHGVQRRGEVLPAWQERRLLIEPTCCSTRLQIDEPCGAFFSFKLADRWSCV